MPDDLCLETTTTVQGAQRERARFAQAEAWANEVLERISGQTISEGTPCPSVIPAVVDQDINPVIGGRYR